MSQRAQGAATHEEIVTVGTLIDIACDVSCRDAKLIRPRALIDAAGDVAGIHLDPVASWPIGDAAVNRTRTSCREYQRVITAWFVQGTAAAAVTDLYLVGDGGGEIAGTMSVGGDEEGQYSQGKDSSDEAQE
ncbi:hypothetical protein PSCICM_37840 [Pseudomonas cichorii]|nr:hypothetical protein PSCICM_37840 [Pseudomonas cichorii]